MIVARVVYFLLFRDVPMLGASIAIKDYRVLDGILGSSRVGLENFHTISKARTDDHDGVQRPQ